jgi:hypothetical protein
LKTKGSYLVWKTEGKHINLLMMTFAYYSTCYLFNAPGTNPHL